MVAVRTGTCRKLEDWNWRFWGAPRAIKQVVFRAKRSRCLGLNFSSGIGAYGIPCSCSSRREVARVGHEHTQKTIYLFPYQDEKIGYCTIFFVLLLIACCSEFGPRAGARSTHLPVRPHCLANTRRLNRLAGCDYPDDGWVHLDRDPHRAAPF